MCPIMEVKRKLKVFLPPKPMDVTIKKEKSENIKITSVEGDQPTNIRQMSK